MFNIIKPGTKIDFMGQASVFGKVSLALFVGALLVIALKGLNLGLDFAGGYSILLEYEGEPTAAQVRQRLEALFPDVDTSVQSFELETPGKTHFLTRILRSESLGEDEVTSLQSTLKSTFGERFVRLKYDAEVGDILDVQLTAASSTIAAVDTSSAAVAGIIEKAGHDVAQVRRIGRDDEVRYLAVLVGVSAELVEGMKTLDPSVRAIKTEFVGPTVGRQLRDDGLLAVLYAMGIILVYVALRFDFYYSPGAIICLLHDAVITTALLSLIGEQFSLATIAGLLTLVGYSINDTIVVFDRIRETAEKARGKALVDVLNRAINETLGRTLMTSLTTLLACASLMVFGRGTVLASFGLIMTVGILIGTYSSIYVASPLFRMLREKFADDDAEEERRKARASNPDKAVV